MSQLLLVTQRRSSSGLPVYLEEEFSSQGWTPSMIDWCASRIATLGSFIRSVQPTKQRWHDKRERTGFYSVAAWERNTAHNGRLLERALQPGGKVLQIGGLYAPHPRFRQLEYYLFFTYTMKLAFADGISPWVPPMNERRAFVERETELYRHARHIFVSASFVKEHLVAEYRIAPDRVTVVGMGVNDFYLANARPPASETRRHCLFAGFLQPGGECRTGDTHSVDDDPHSRLMRPSQTHHAAIAIDSYHKPTCLSIRTFQETTGLSRSDTSTAADFAFSPISDP
jgi:hypothetical protein